MTTRTSCKTRVCEFTGAFGDVSTHSSSEGMRLAFPDRLCDTPGSRVQRETKPTNCDARAKTVEAWTLNTASQPEINYMQSTSARKDTGRRQNHNSVCMSPTRGRRCLARVQRTRSRNHDRRSDIPDSCQEIGRRRTIAMSLRHSQSDAWDTPANTRVVGVKRSIVAQDSGWKPRLPRKAEVVDGLAWQEGVVLRRSPQAFAKTLCFHDKCRLRRDRRRSPLCRWRCGRCGCPRTLLFTCGRD